ncbi:hypothetical protein SELR_pSRC102020 (plasmid) [Selenomonas ruminantium subsp. lactilytica TAM6421]|uniref:TPR repeat n=1 Tax=Selenomonas ruminantium subsp. lactilytica (strain NBRC 103574 / TAM6421) TaxID=927704 RepID=I0GW72_SELRL|nr:SEL1-like repeat protein [Selenomonas ruminantium]BAL85009.1 hypothetical protein SELR_pSRC102020 [Selenomonas ruminantium subsp. lactilytica TAM6421]
MGVFNKLELLDTTESYIIDSALGCIDVKENEITRNDLRDNLTKKYISQSALVNINTKISIYNFIVELLYTLQQAEAEKILFLEQETTLHEAIDLYIHCHMNEAADKFLPLAESGNTKAMYLLGDIYRNYSSVEFHSIGESWQKKGAYLQDPLCMISTIPNEDDVLIMEDIIEKLKDLSYQNDMFAQYELGYCYEYGRCVEKDAELAKKWYLTAAKLGHFKSMNKLGLLYAADRDYIEANKWYKLAGENGYNEGWYNLGKSYHYGIGVEIDSDIAIYYYQKSFNLHGNCSGEIANQIGLVYHEIKKENEPANHWFKRAGELGYSYGWSNLASSYENGRGVSIDIEKAKEYYIKAYDIGDNSAGKFANSIGVIFANEKNYTSAYKWFHLAAKDGFGWGFYNLGCLFYHGLGVEKNNDIAIYYYEKTSYIDSLKMLGKIYYEKISVN